MDMLRDLLIDQELFEILRTRSLESDDCGMNTTKEVELLEKAVFNRLKKKRSVKKYKKLGVTKGDLKQIIQLADIMGLDTLDGPSNYELAMNMKNGVLFVEDAAGNLNLFSFIEMNSTCYLPSTQIWRRKSFATKSSPNISK